MSIGMSAWCVAAGTLCPDARPPYISPSPQNACRYDSVPSDLGALFVATHCKEKLGKKLGKLTMVVADGPVGVSGGTVASSKLACRWLRVPAMQVRRVAVPAVNPGACTPPPTHTQCWVQLRMPSCP
jgi:hypothetical protein